MGIVKEYMHELWSQIEAQVSFRCPKCSKSASFRIQIPGGEEIITENVTCANPDDDEHEWTLKILKGYTGYDAYLEEEPDVHVLIETDDNIRYWEEPEPEPQPYQIFLEAMEEWRSNVLMISVPEGHSSRNRMLFGTLFSIAESYFSDIIIGSAIADTKVQRGLIDLEELGLCNKQLSLATVLDNPEIVQEMIRTSLQGLSYHNLRVVNRISRSAFGLPILPSNKKDRDAVLASVPKRHDCVHRNGLNKNGIKHTDINPEYLMELGRIFEEMAASLEGAIRNAQVKRFFKAEDSQGSLQGTTSP